MAEMRDEELVLLANLMYLNGFADAEENTKVSDVVIELLIDNGKYFDRDNQSKDQTKLGTDDEYPGKMTRDEWIQILENVKESPELMELSIKKKHNISQ